jgi:hypothetical protein
LNGQIQSYYAKLFHGEMENSDFPSRNNMLYVAIEE